MHLRVLVLVSVVSSTYCNSSPGWNLQDGILLGIEDVLGNPLHRALESLPALLGDDYLERDLDIPGALDSLNDTLTDDNDAALRYYLPSPHATGNVSEACRHDVSQILVAQTLDKPWPNILADSWGKFPDGVMSGNWMPLGMMEECTGLRVNEQLLPTDHEKTTFNGKYCMVIHSGGWDQGSRAGVSSVSGNIPNAIFGGPTYGTCMPDSCSTDDFMISLEEVLPEGKRVNAIYCHTKDEELVWEDKDVAFVCIFGILIFIVMSSAIVDLTINYFDAHHMRKGPLRYFLAFSAYSNMSKIFYINIKPNPIAINCLHGMRVLSMTWVVWGQIYAFDIYLVENALNMKNVFGSFLDETIMNGFLSVDSFFFMSGLLVAYNLMRDQEEMDLYKFAMFYIHRILRLLPPIAFMCFFLATVARFLNTGPLSEIINESNIYPCNTDWFYDVLFINNIAQKWCMGHTWYVSADMQLYVLLPIIFFPLMYYEMIGAFWLAFMTVISMVVPIVLTHIYELPLIPVDLEGPGNFPKDWSFLYYYATWSRAGPYMVGLWAGYILHKTNKTPLKMKQWQVVLGWGLAITVGLLVCYGIYPYNKPVDPITPDQALVDIYNGCARAAWGLALLWVVLACHTGNGGLINSFLGHPSWQPLSRLTYHIFLVAVTVDIVLLGSEFRLGYYNHLNNLIKTCGVLFIAGIAATILSLLTEGPVVNLEKLLLNKSDVKSSNSTTKLENDDKGQKIC